MKKTILIVFAVLLSIITTSAQKNKECKAWKTGRFYMIAPDGTRIEIARKGNNQVEYNTKTGESLHLKIRWTSPCSYQLKDDPKFDDKNDISGMILNVSIIEIKEAYVMIEFSSNMFDMKLQDRFFRSEKK